MPAHYLHRAEPVGGFGEDNFDARIVLICFFKVDNADSKTGDTSGLRWLYRYGL